MKRSIIANFTLLILALGIASSCQKETSTSTGWDYNNVKNGGFEKANFEEQRTGPGLVMIEGGTFTMGRTEEDVFEDNDNRPNRFTVSSFYMDRTEVTNFHWLEYVYWMKRVYNKTYPHIYKKSLPDTNCWRDPLSYREKFVEYYFRYPAYRDYPVVGISWLQANDFCKWRTDRVNEYILVEQGIIKWHFADRVEEGGDLGAMGPPGQVKKAKKTFNAPENMFNTESYLAGQYNIELGKVQQDKSDELNYKYTGTGYTLTDGKAPGKAGETYPRDPYQLNDYDPVFAVNDDGNFYQGKRNVRMEDGILLPNYRLPTEAEWEFAATGLLGNLDANSENVDERRVYPWDGHYVRYDEEQFQGTIQANFVRGTGDHMGVAGALNDGADATAQVDAYWPNDFGLYNMAGNVSEWVLDTYRPSTSEVADGFMPFRGNMYQAKLMVPDGLHEKYVKTKDNIYDVYGMKEFVNEYARILYLSTTQNALDPTGNYSANLQSQIKSNSLIPTTLNVVPTASGPYAKYTLINGYNYVAIGDTLSFVVKSTKAAATYKALVNDNKGAKGSWVNTVPGAEEVRNLGDSVFAINFTQANPSPNDTGSITFSIGNEFFRMPIKVISSKTDLNPYVNSTASGVKISSQQDSRKYKFNSLSKYYTANNKLYSESDKAKFQVLDDINALLDTAIYLYNKGNTVKSSAYIEAALFGSKTMTEIINSDIRSKEIIDAYYGGEGNGKIEALGVFMKRFDDQGNPEDGDFQSVFDDEKVTGTEDRSYLGTRFPNYKVDQTITTWLLVLRNGLTEYTMESRGKQRWRNVTEDENLGRLNYRKDDYIDYMDGDLESSIFYNSNKRISDINSGKLNAKNTVYQSEHENYDLQGNPIALGPAGDPKSLISDKSKVYKGGSWADRAYWLSAGNRRFLDQDKTSATIGFRCAMDRLGEQRNMNYKRRRRK
jgi:formylglycine-generating enzyme required for sulfatase activity